MLPFQTLSVQNCSHFDVKGNSFPPAVLLHEEFDVVLCLVAVEPASATLTERSRWFASAADATLRPEATKGTAHQLSTFSDLERCFCFFPFLPALPRWRVAAQERLCERERRTGDVEETLGEAASLPQAAVRLALRDGG